MARAEIGLEALNEHVVPENHRPSSKRRGEVMPGIVSSLRQRASPDGRNSSCARNGAQAALA